MVTVWMELEYGVLKHERNTGKNVGQGLKHLAPAFLEMCGDG